MSAGATARAAQPSVLQGPEHRRSTSDEFYERHRRRPYTMDFNASKEAVMRNDRMDINHRVLEALKVTAWYAHRDYSADEKGRPLTKSDIARLIGATTQRVSEACQYWEAEFHIRTVNRVIFVIDDPILERMEAERRTNGEGFPDPSGKLARPKTETEEISEALAYLESSDPTWFTQYQTIDHAFQQAAEERKLLRQQALERYRATQPAQAEPEVELSRPGREVENSGFLPDGAESDPETVGNEGVSSFIGLKASKKLAGADAEENELEQAIRETLHRSRLVLVGGKDRDPGTVAVICSHLRRLRNPRAVREVLDILEDKCRFLERRPDEADTKTWGWVVGVVKGEVERRLGRSRPTEPPQPNKTPTQTSAEIEAEVKAEIAELAKAKGMR